MPDAGVSFFLPRVVGLGRAMQMSMLGEAVDAEEAGSAADEGPGADQAVPPRQLRERPGDHPRAGGPGTNPLRLHAGSQGERRRLLSEERAELHRAVMGLRLDSGGYLSQSPLPSISGLLLPGRP